MSLFFYLKSVHFGLKRNNEKKAQLAMLNQQGQQPPPGPPPAGGDNSMMIIAAVVGVIFIAGVGYVMMNKKQAPVVAPVLKAA
ncbi:hypothetical protein HYX58_06465 [Candidatus Dependentiae bacterium]|nr:hypothetical protein [Candidatus Dependentiae bacterium]